MRVVHEPADDGTDPDRPADDGTDPGRSTGDGTDPGRSAGDGTVLASDVDVADSFGAMLRGLTFRSSIPDDYALVFPFDDAGFRSVHMLFVRFPIDVVWTVDDEVQKVSTLRPWIGFGWATGDRFIELPAGTAANVDPGDLVRVEDE